MGCGAVCGNNSSIYEPNKFQHKILLTLLPRLKLHKQFIPPRQYHTFLKLIHQNPLKYKIKLPNKLIPGQQIDSDIITKWKVMLYCLDTENQDFRNFLTQNSLKKQTQNQPRTSHQEIINFQTQPDLQQQESDYVMSEQTGVIFTHKEFSQIEKDIDRTCDLPSDKKVVFERILKRISNFFPTMGYTQGINFIIGYLLMIGLSEFDVFWMFVHIAISRRYLLLGLFQDRFPLSDIYKNIFKNILKRINAPLYQHLYEHLHMNESVWVFKWFFTYFIYSFPHQMIKYVFDIVIQIGGLGLIKFAIAITQELSTVLMENHDECEISIFFQSLRDVDTFNEYISIKKVVQKVYSMEIKRQDFEGIEAKCDSFYASFIMANLQNMYSHNSTQLALIKVEQNKKQKKQQENDLTNKVDDDQNSLPNKLVKQWYDKLLSERQHFITTKTKSTFDNVNIKVERKPSDQFRQRKRSQRLSIENQLYLLVHQDQNLQQVKSPQKQNSVKSNKNSSIKDSVENKKNSIPSTGYSYNQKGTIRQNRDDVSEIDELWDEEDCNSSVSKNMSSRISQQSRTQNGFNLKVKKTQYEDELDKFASTHCNPLNKSKYNNSNINKTSSIFNDQKATSYRPKINNFQIPSDRSKGGHLIKAAQHILTNLSIKQNSQQFQSSNSQYSKMSQKQKKSKENDLYSRNYLKNKMKKKVSLHHQTQNIPQKGINKQISQQDCNSSSRDSCIDPQNSFYVSNESIHESQLGKSNIDACSVRDIDSHRNRMATHQDILTNSLHSSHIKQNNLREVGESNVSEIQLFQAPQVFKKKNRVSSRIDGAQNQGTTQIVKPRLSHAASNANIHHNVGNKSMKKIKFGIEESIINYEQSYESIFVPSESQKSNTLRFHQQVQKCEVESVK